MEISSDKHWQVAQGRKLCSHIGETESNQRSNTCIPCYVSEYIWFKWGFHYVKIRHIKTMRPTEEWTCNNRYFNLSYQVRHLSSNKRCTVIIMCTEYSRDITWRYTLETKWNKLAPLVSLCVSIILQKGVVFL